MSPIAVFHFNDAYISINDVVLDDHATSVDLSTDVNILEDTHFGDSWEGKIPGMKSWSATVELSQDFAASSVDATLWAAHGTSVTCEFRPTSDAASATNPKFTGSVIVNYGGPLGNGVGDRATASVTLTGTGALTRATA